MQKMMTKPINLLIEKSQPCIFILQHPNFRPGFEAAQIAAVLQIAWYFVSLDYPPFFQEFTERRNTNSNAKYFGKPLPYM